MHFRSFYVICEMSIGFWAALYRYDCPGQAALKVFLIEDVEGIL